MPVGKQFFTELSRVPNGTQFQRGQIGLGYSFHTPIGTDGSENPEITETAEIRLTFAECVRPY
jgi:hypothetical protein